MILLYSGAEKHGYVQLQPFLSIGGFVASTPVRNGIKGGVFSNILLKDVKNKTTQHRLIVLKNTSGGTINNIKFWIEPDSKVQSPIAIYKGGLVLPALDANGIPSFEKIYSEEDTPFNAVFSDIEGEVNKITLASLVNNAYVGIWLRREIDTTNENYFDAEGNWCLDTDKMYEDAQGDPQHFFNKKVEAFSLKIQY